MKNKCIATLLALSLCTSVQAKNLKVHTGQFVLDENTPATIPIEPIPTYIGQDGLENLYKRFRQHYGPYVRDENPQKVDFEFLAGLKNHQATIELQTLFDLALNERLPLEGLAEFGITVENQRNYTYNLKQQPHLALASELFNKLTEVSDVDINSPYLIERGFRQSDLDTLKQFLSQFDTGYIEHKLQKEQIRYVQEALPSMKAAVAKKMVLSTDSYYRKMLVMAYYRHHVEQNVWRNWGLKMMATLDPQRQRILADYLVEKITGLVSMTSVKTPNKALSWERRIESGELARVIQAGLVKYNLEAK